MLCPKQCPEVGTSPLSAWLRIPLDGPGVALESSQPLCSIHVLPLSLQPRCGRRSLGCTTISHVVSPLSHLCLCRMSPGLGATFPLAYILSEFSFSWLCQIQALHSFPTEGGLGKQGLHAEPNSAETSRVLLTLLQYFNKQLCLKLKHMSFLLSLHLWSQGLREWCPWGWSIGMVNNSNDNWWNV